MENLKSFRVGRFRAAAFYGSLLAVLLTGACTNRSPLEIYLSGPDLLKNQGMQITVLNGTTPMGSIYSMANKTNHFDLFPGVYRVKMELDEGVIFWSNDFYFSGSGAASPAEMVFPFSVTPISLNQWKAGTFQSVSNGINVEYQIYSFPVASGPRTYYVYSDGLYFGSGTYTAVVQGLATADSLSYIVSTSFDLYSHPLSIETYFEGRGYVLVRCTRPGTYAIKVSNG
ncbi:MAG: hypothetical protein JNM63_08425 [Spirochaetia bacterium]|nr:hypothetical protein [Spirochaetia bacterium]